MIGSWGGSTCRLDRHVNLGCKSYVPSEDALDQPERIDEAEEWHSDAFEARHVA